MGYGSYDLEAHQAMTAARAAQAKAHRSADDAQRALFTQTECHPSMAPFGVKARESRDSDAHPNSTGIVFALDVSGSMGSIPVRLATDTLPAFMGAVGQFVADPQVMFIAFGNADSDESPLQVGQFESEAPLMDKWLSNLHLEGRGGGLGESYDLALYFAAHHTAMDCWERRQRKGYLFMTGDEPPFVYLARTIIERVVGDAVPADIRLDEVIRQAQARFHVFFLIPDPSRAVQFNVRSIWFDMLHERTIVLGDPSDAAIVSALLVGITEGALTDRASIRAAVTSRFGKSDGDVDRLVGAVMPYAEALARGPIAGPKEPIPNRNPPPAAG